MNYPQAAHVLVGIENGPNHFLIDHVQPEIDYLSTPKITEVTLEAYGLQETLEGDNAQYAAFTRDIANEARETAGVDPHDCLDVMVLDTKRRIPLEPYFEYLSAGIMLVVSDGDWGRHDEEFHIAPAFVLNPEYVKFIKMAALQAKAYIAQDEREKAKDIANAHDTVISRFRYFSGTVRGLVALSGYPRPPEGFPQFCDRMVEDQKEYEKFFEKIAFKTALDI